MRLGLFLTTPLGEAALTCAVRVRSAIRLGFAIPMDVAPLSAFDSTCRGARKPHRLVRAISRGFDAMATAVAVCSTLPGASMLRPSTRQCRCQGKLPYRAHKV